MHASQTIAHEKSRKNYAPTPCCFMASTLALISSRNGLATTAALTLIPLVASATIKGVVVMGDKEEDESGIVVVVVVVVARK
jgi:hypothetical protein